METIESVSQFHVFYVWVNSLLPLGRYINMDPYPTCLLIS